MSLFNLRRVATSTTGSGTITLGSAVTGFKATTDAPAIADQTWVTYAIADTSNSEIGYGLYSTSGPTLTRNVIESTNSNTPISLSGNAQVFITPSAGDLQSNTAFPNRFRNGGMDIFQKGNGTLTITTGLSVTNGSSVVVSSTGYTADGWIVVPTGASVTSARTTGRSLTAYSLLVTGNTSVTDVIVKQRIESRVASAMTSQTVVFQAWVKNNTGGSITPTLTVIHPTATDDYTGTVTDVSAVSLQACPNTSWTQVMYAFTASSSSALGMEVSLDFGNNFSSNAKSIQLTEVDLRVAPGYLTGLTQIAPYPQFRPVHEELVFCQRYYDKSVNQSADIGLNVFTAGGAILTSDGSVLHYSQTMRVPPTLTTYDNPGNVNKITQFIISNWTDNITPQFGEATDKNTSLFLNQPGAAFNFDYTASAEL